MRFIHLSDLHIGRQLHQYNLKEDQEHILGEVVEYARMLKPDAIVIAGDVYDKSVPSAEAVGIFDWFLTALSACEQIKNNDEVTLIGSEYTLFINTDEVMIRANNLAIETDEILEDDFHYYDEESIAFCGTTDFIHFLNAYFEFIA